MCEQLESPCSDCGSILCSRDCKNSKMMCVSCAMSSQDSTNFEVEGRFGLRFEDSMRRSAQESCTTAKCVCECHAGEFCGPPMGPVVTPSRSDPGSPFLRLPPEIRNMIYHELLLPVGNERFSPSYVGRVHLSILETCRQIYQEARTIPLSGNTLWFANQVQAHLFLHRFSEHPQFPRITSMHLDLDQEEINCRFFPFLCAEHAKSLSSLNRLLITVKGSIDERSLAEDSNLMKGLEKFKDLKFFELELPRSNLPQSVKDEAVERFKKRLLTKPEEISTQSELTEGSEEVQIPEHDKIEQGMSIFD